MLQRSVLVTLGYDKLLQNHTIKVATLVFAFRLPKATHLCSISLVL
jgi:hypothetical protein